MEIAETTSRSWRAPAHSSGVRLSAPVICRRMPSAHFRGLRPPGWLMHMASILRTSRAISGRGRGRREEPRPARPIRAPQSLRWAMTRRRPSASRPAVERTPAAASTASS